MWPSTTSEGSWRACGLPERSGRVRVPGPVWWAAALTALHAVLASIGTSTAISTGQTRWIFVGFAVAIPLALGTIGLVLLASWAQSLVVTMSGLFWLLSLLSGSIGVGTNIIVVILLLLPSSRAAFAAKDTARRDRSVGA